MNSYYCFCGGLGKSYLKSVFVQIVEFSPHKTSNFFNKLAFPHILMYFSNFAEKLLVWNCSKFFGTPGIYSASSEQHNKIVFAWRM